MITEFQTSRNNDLSNPFNRLAPRPEVSRRAGPGDVVDLSPQALGLVGSAAGSGTYTGKASETDNVTAIGSITYPSRSWMPVTESFDFKRTSGQVDVNQTPLSTDVFATVTDQHGYSYGVGFNVDRDPRKDPSREDPTNAKTWAHTVTIDGHKYPASVTNMAGADGSPRTTSISYADSDGSRRSIFMRTDPSSGRHSMAFHPPYSARATQDRNHKAEIGLIQY